MSRETGVVVIVRNQSVGLWSGIGISKVPEPVAMLNPRSS